MLTGEELRKARIRAGLTQEQLATRIGVTQRSVGNWERGTVPRDQQERLQNVLADHLQGVTPISPPLSTASDAQLLAEIARRFDRGRGEHGGDTAAKTSPDGADNVTRLRPDEKPKPPTSEDLEDNERFVAYRPKGPRDRPSFD